MSLSMRDVPVNCVAYGGTDLTSAWRLVLSSKERGVWKALQGVSERNLSVSFGDLAQEVGLSMSALKTTLYALQRHGLLDGMPD